MMTYDEVVNKRKEEFRNINMRYLYLIGCDEASEDLGTASDKRIEYEAYNFAIRYFEKLINDLNPEGGV